MSSNFREAIKLIREKEINQTDVGTAFEKLVKVFLENDATQTQQYEKVWRYSEWAGERKGYARKDIGIDLVAKIRDQDTFCSIQCKCYSEGVPIQKTHLDSFVLASSTKDFSRLLLIDTSTERIGDNAQQVLDNLDKDYLRIPITELENSRIDWLTLVKEDRIRLRQKNTSLDHQKEGVSPGDNHTKNPKVTSN